VFFVKWPKNPRKIRCIFNWQSYSSIGEDTAEKIHSYFIYCIICWLVVMAVAPVCSAGVENSYKTDAALYMMDDVDYWAADVGLGNDSGRLITTRPTGGKYNSAPCAIGGAGVGPGAGVCVGGWIYQPIYFPTEISGECEVKLYVICDTVAPEVYFGVVIGDDWNIYDYQKSFDTEAHTLLPGQVQEFTGKGKISLEYDEGSRPSVWIYYYSTAVAMPGAGGTIKLVYGSSDCPAYIKMPLKDAVKISMHTQKSSEKLGVFATISNAIGVQNMDITNASLTVVETGKKLGNPEVVSFDNATATLKFLWDVSNAPSGTYTLLLNINDIHGNNYSFSSPITVQQTGASSGNTTGQRTIPGFELIAFVAAVVAILKYRRRFSEL